MKRRKKPKNISRPIVRKLRTELGLSQQELAEKCQLKGWDISRDTVAKIEGQTRWVSDIELVQLSRVLGIEVGILLKNKIPTEY